MDTLKQSRWRGMYNKVKKGLADLVRQEWLKFGAIVLPKKQYIVVGRNFEWNGNRDVDNVGSSVKIILDALQVAGLIENDNLEWVRQKEDVVEVAQSQEEVGVQIEFWFDDSLLPLVFPKGREREIERRFFKPKKKPRRKPGNGMFNGKANDEGHKASGGDSGINTVGT